jgi:hypothetical protein
MPLGPDRCTGPSGYMYSTVPPPVLMWTEGSISSCYRITSYQYLYLYYYSNSLIFCSNKYCVRIGCYLDCQFSLDIILWYGSQIWITIFMSISFDIRTARVRCRGVIPPPLPGHVPPAGGAVLSGVLCEHMCSCGVT